MRHSHSITLLAGTALCAFLGVGGVVTATPAAAAEVAKATSTPADGVVYTGTSAATQTRITLSGTTFVIDDNGPVTAGTGCTAVVGDPTQVRCAAPKDTLGKFRRPKLSALGGADTIVNASPVGMVADGGSGGDALRGSLDLSGNDDMKGGDDNDLLVGNGGFDRLNGGSGADTLDAGTQNDTLIGGGGPDRITGGDGDDVFLAEPAFDGTDVVDLGIGAHDRVDYTNRTVEVHLSLLGDAGSGELNEKDTLINAEDADGSLSAPNLLIGTDAENKLLGGTADDLIFGGKGKDRLFGGEGADTISSNSFFTTTEDGASDVIDAGNDADTCIRSVPDGDLVFECETLVD